MTDRWQPGQLLFVGFEGTRPPSDLVSQIEAGRIGGVVLFARNLEDPDQVRALVTGLCDAAPPDLPLAVAIDQEGGRVQRLREPWTRWPPMREVGGSDDLERTQAVGAAIGVELKDMGMHLDFAPVVDVDSNPDNPVIGDRSFSREPERVGAHAAAFIRGMQGAGVAACAKHFPGHGDTNLDSHLDLPRLELDLDRLHRVELPPFRAALDAEVASVMTAHVLFPRLDKKRPATLSPEIMSVLRETLGFKGLVFTDDLEMGAVAKHFSVEERVLGPLQAGVDALLICRQADLRNEALRLVEKASDDLLEPAIGRVLGFKDRFMPRPSHAGGQGPALVVPAARLPGDPPYDDHRRLAESFGDD